MTEQSRHYLEQVSQDIRKQLDTIRTDSQQRKQRILDWQCSKDYVTELEALEILHTALTLLFCMEATENCNQACKFYKFFHNHIIFNDTLLYNSHQLLGELQHWIYDCRTKLETFSIDELKTTDDNLNKLIELIDQLTILSIEQSTLPGLESYLARQIDVHAFDVIALIEKALALNLAQDPELLNLYQTLVTIQGDPEDIVVTEDEQPVYLQDALYEIQEQIRAKLLVQLCKEARVSQSAEINSLENIALVNAAESFCNLKKQLSFHNLSKICQEFEETLSSRLSYAGTNPYCFDALQIIPHVFGSACEQEAVISQDTIAQLRHICRR